MWDDRTELKTTIPRYSRGLALCYGIHGVVVGTFYLNLGLMGFLNFHSAGESIAFLAAGILQPAPMFLTALALGRGWRWARRLAVFLPVFFVICVLARYLVAIRLGTILPVFYVVAYSCEFQIMNLPGAIVLAIAAALLLKPDASSG